MIKNILGLPERYELLEDMKNSHLDYDYYNAKKGDIFVWSEWHGWYQRLYGIGYAAPFLKKDFVENNPHLFKELNYQP